jgi:hypothetical protein
MQAAEYRHSVSPGVADAARHIALITDGTGIGAALNYTIGVSQRHGAQIDLLIHGAVDVECISDMEKQTHAADIICHQIQLYARAIEDLLKYVTENSSLMFLVASPDDSAARLLVEEVIPRRRTRMTVPLVLIDDHSFANAQTLNAA